MKKSVYDVRPLQPGVEYDLVNISLIGRDPVTGRTYDECYLEWSEWMEELRRDSLALRWWQLRRRVRVVRAAMILEQRLGMTSY